MSNITRLLDYFRAADEGARYEPSEEEDVRTMVKLLDLQSDDVAVDLGAGDGRVVLAMAQRGTHSVGIEKDRALAAQARAAIDRQGLANRARIIQDSFWKIRLHPFNKVTLFQCSWIMDRMENKLRSELPWGAYVVSHHWKFPHWQPVKTVRDIYLYIM